MWKLKLCPLQQILAINPILCVTVQTVGFADNIFRLLAKDRLSLGFPLAAK